MLQRNDTTNVVKMQHFFERNNFFLRLKKYFEAKKYFFRREYRMRGINIFYRNVKKFCI